MHVILSTVRMQCHIEKRKSIGSKYLWHKSRYFCSSSCTENIQHIFKYLWNYNLKDTQIHGKCPHVENSQMQLALASMTTYHINFHYYSHTQHNSWHSYQTASPALQVVGYFHPYACLDVAWCVCLCVRPVGEPSKSRWTDQDVVWLTVTFTLTLTLLTVHYHYNRRLAFYMLEYSSRT